jgi:hypothetical protein
MENNDYMADTICRAMGLPGFADDPALRERGDCLRVLFMPSFHPEVCVTCWSEGEGTGLQVAARREMFWRERARHLPVVILTVTVAAPSFATLAEDFATAAEELSGERKWFTLDGMPTAVLRQYADGTTATLEDWPNHSPALFRLCVSLVEAAWAVNDRPPLALALAEVGGYLGLKYPVQRPPAEEPPTRLLVLGTPEERADYFGQLDESGR